MQEYQMRVVLEKQELDAKRDKLTEFLKSDKSQSVETKELERLVLQSHIMLDYSNVLGERIANFPPE